MVALDNTCVWAHAWHVNFMLFVSFSLCCCSKQMIDNMCLTVKRQIPY